MTKRARLHDTNADVPHKKHKLLDLRNTERFEAFNCHKFVFKIHTSEVLHVMTHSSSTPQEVQKVNSVLEIVLKDGLDIMHEKHIPPYAIIHIYIHCKEMDSDFIFNGVGPKRVTFKQMREGRLRDVVTGFSKMIQSGKDVTLDDHTVITFYAFIPPVEYR